MPAHHECIEGPRLCRKTTLGDEPLAREAVEAFRKKLEGLDERGRPGGAWLDLHRYAGLGQALYDTLDEFTQQRREHSTRRRLR